MQSKGRGREVSRETSRIQVIHYSIHSNLVPVKTMMLGGCNCEYNVRSVCDGISDKGGG